MAPLVGQTLSHYHILGKIGAGGMGEVYRAKDDRLGREVAIKVLPAAYSADPERMRRFEQEARAAGMLNHPNILTIYDIGTHEGSTTGSRTCRIQRARAVRCRPGLVRRRLPTLAADLTPTPDSGYHGWRGTKVMTVREELHRIVDELPEEELTEVRQFIDHLKAGNQGEESLSAETLAAIQEGLEDIKAGRTVSWEQVKRENGP